MGRLIYAANVSLDGYLEDESGAFDWSEPDEEIHAFWNDHERRIGTSLYGRRMYETMRVWQDDDWLVDEPAVVREYAQVWRDTDKVVCSTTLAVPSTARTRIERTFEPGKVRALKAGTTADLSIGGATVAVEAFRHGPVDEIVLAVCPVLVVAASRRCHGACGSASTWRTSGASPTGSSSCGTRCAGRTEGAPWRAA